MHAGRRSLIGLLVSHRTTALFLFPYSLSVCDALLMTEGTGEADPFHEEVGWCGALLFGPYSAPVRQCTVDGYLARRAPTSPLVPVGGRGVAASCGCGG